MTEDLKRDIAEAISPALTDGGFELVELKLARYGRSSRLQIFIDKQTAEGVSLGDCASVSRKAGEIVEAKELIEGKYTLEVSSPGIDRPLHTKNDFVRKIGRTIQVDFIDTGRKSVRGLLEEVSETAINVKAKKETEIVLLNDIAVAREYI